MDPFANPELWTADWWNLFLRSPGFGGLAALGAAIIGALALWSRARVDKDLHAKDQKARLDAADKLRKDEIEQARAEQWFEIYQWLLKQLNAKPPTIDTAKATLLLEFLDAAAPGDVEKNLVSIALDLLIEETT
jgi:hypothetical protein